MKSTVRQTTQGTFGPATKVLLDHLVEPQKHNTYHKQTEEVSNIPNDHHTLYNVQLGKVASELESSFEKLCKYM